MAYDAGKEFTWLKLSVRVSNDPTASNFFCFNVLILCRNHYGTFSMWFYRIISLSLSLQSCVCSLRSRSHLTWNLIAYAALPASFLFAIDRPKRPIPLYSARLPNREKKLPLKHDKIIFLLHLKLISIRFRSFRSNVRHCSMLSIGYRGNRCDWNWKRFYSNPAFKCITSARINYAATMVFSHVFSLW